MHPKQMQINQIVGEVVRRIRQNIAFKKFKTDIVGLILNWMDIFYVQSLHVLSSVLGYKVFDTLVKYLPFERHNWMLSNDIEEI